MTTSTTLTQDRYKILIIDDNPSDLSLLLPHLVNHNLELRIAEDAMLGCSMAISDLPDLILLDINMPKLDGFTTLRLLKNASNEVQQIPVIFVTANNDEDKRVEGLLLGAVDYIVKPFNPQEALLRITLHLHIGRKLKQQITTPNPTENLHDLTDSINLTIETTEQLTATDNNKADNKADNKDYDQILVTSVTQYLSQHIADPPNIKEISERFGTYEKRLNQAFSNVFGCTLFVWLREERLRLAREMLLSGFVTASRISEVLGYSSPAHFNRAFREHYGCTPKTLQKENKATR